ncbi:B3/4 domain-containing protein [Companilactobacillus ginsenosidimutans]|uniref:tRNA synthetase subunit beta n=1 Tax=Companilactobacillus ginsenosidimutans TaxID=1007676 RepID=A0A0H4QXS8_9LACO|nr:phenylalanine--tRNA ligase beta subunit-related protein [Companilactobacillus ginsenosidimutans]AKP66280.1 tRNA synthetase subunit beta [Companilactobacillus ginsenosidimutans]
MKNIVIDKEFWDLFPQGQISILRLEGIDNHVNEDDDPYFQKLLDDATEESKKFLTDETFRLNPVIDQWREALRKFKTKKGARSSIEALLKRVSQGKTFSPINPLVDIYNSVSLKYAMPCGGENVDKMDGDLHLGMAKGGEGFRPLGDDEDSPALEGEIIYYDKTGAVCRCMNWREAQRTMLTEDTTNAVMVIEGINDEQAKRADEAVIELKNLCKDYFKVDGEIGKLTIDNATEIIEK